MMAPAAAEEEEDVALAAASVVSGRRRRGQRKLAAGWGAVFCFGFGSRRRERGEEALADEGTMPPPEGWVRRRKRNVSVDGDPVPGTSGSDAMRRGAGDSESRCCFLFVAPARAPGRRKHNALDSGSSSTTHDEQRQLEHTEQRPPPRPPSEAPAAPSSRTQATVGSRSRRAERPRGAPAEPRARARTGPRPSDSGGSGKGEEAPERGPCAKAVSAGVGAFGPVVGLSVVAAVSMAGLLGGRVWAVACACAWLAALSRLLRRREAPAAGSDGGEEAVANVDSKEYKKLVVLRGLLDRDRGQRP